MIGLVRRLGWLLSLGLCVAACGHRRQLVKDDPEPVDPPSAPVAWNASPPPTVARPSVPPIESPVDPTLPETMARAVKLQSILTEREEEERKFRDRARDYEGRHASDGESPSSVEAFHERWVATLTHGLRLRLKGYAAVKHFKLVDEPVVDFRFSEDDDSTGVAEFSVSVQDATPEGEKAETRVWKGEATFRRSEDDPSQPIFTILEPRDDESGSGGGSKSQGHSDQVKA